MRITGRCLCGAVRWVSVVIANHHARVLVPRIPANTWGQAAERLALAFALQCSKVVGKTSDFSSDA